MGSGNSPTTGGNPDVTGGFQYPACRREPCHLDSQGASVFVKDGVPTKLQVEKAYVTGGGIQYPITNAIECQVENQFPEKCHRDDNKDQSSCTPENLVEFAKFIADQYSSIDPENPICGGFIGKEDENTQATFVNSLMGAEIATQMGFEKMIFGGDIGAWNLQFPNQVVLSFSSTKAELIAPRAEGDTPIIVKSKYKDLQGCDYSDFAYKLDSECINATIVDLRKKVDDTTDVANIDYCQKAELMVVASAGVRNDMLSFLEGSKSIEDYFITAFDCNESPTQITIEVMSGEKEAFLGMMQMNDTIGDDIKDDTNIAGYLDFGGSSIQPSFFLKQNIIYPSPSTDLDKGYTPDERMQLNSFLNFGSDAVAQRLSMLYVAYPDYGNACELGHEKMDFDKCKELLRFIASGGDLSLSGEENQQKSKFHLRI